MSGVPQSSFTLTRRQLLAAAVAASTLVLVFQGTFTFLYSQWQRDEYSHGFLIPLVSAFLLWQRR
ncbi:MAG TPA: archaeosortase/exosortase family protein, partial [Burkholderiaceae bacterium]|nr:archaeosortase/exosortase family protein [Burkholderiaceae bacterium]